MEWLLSTDGSCFVLLAQGPGLIISYTPEAAADLTFKGRIFKKYVPQNIYETAPFTLPVDGLEDITSASVAIERIDLDKLRYTITDLPLALELKERLSQGEVTRSGQSGTTYASGPFALRGSLDARGEILAEYGPKTRIGYRFSAPGTYKVVVSAYRKADNSVYYSRELPFEVTNELPQATAVAASVIVDRKGRYIFSAAASYIDPDSRTVAISWKICGQDYPRAVRKVSYLIGDFRQCGETYFTLDGGIGNPVRYDLNIHELITQAIN